MILKKRLIADKEVEDQSLHPQSILKDNLNTQINHGKIIYFNTTCGCRVSLSFLDIMNICFKPVLQSIASIISASLTNTTLNDNAQLHVILADLLKEGIDYFNEKWDTDTCGLVIITELSNQLLRPLINQKPFAYNFFQFGTLNRVSSGNYGFTIT